MMAVHCHPPVRAAPVACLPSHACTAWPFTVHLPSLPPSFFRPTRAARPPPLLISSSATLTGREVPPPPCAVPCAVPPPRSPAARCQPAGPPSQPRAWPSSSMGRHGEDVMGVWTHRVRAVSDTLPRPLHPYNPPRALISPSSCLPTHSSPHRASRNSAPACHAYFHHAIYARECTTRMYERAPGDVNDQIGELQPYTIGPP